VRLTFIETPIFARQIGELLNEEEQRQLQNFLLEQPEEGVLIRGTGGARKMRFAFQAKGKRGGLRIIYTLLGERALMLLAYSKNVQADISPKTKKELAQIIARFK
jgi:mRNA-degrading endonuclease RelE of RelBE toxin-antitoxin system